ncbi:GNAT family N-acetyltransferase [Cardiobacterium sp. AH-315-I02]|nr:GNAT family N-acetyltransferase [Cardiobacterium sp. AH-315-I02]
MSDNEEFVLELYDPGKTYTNQKQFDCENKTINKFVSSSLKKQVRQSLSQCFVLLDTNNNDRFIGFYTLSSYAINADMLDKLSDGSLPSRIPCSRLIMLGVDKNYKKRGLGKLLIQSVIQKTIIAAEQIGIYGLFLNAHEKAYTCYIEHGFIALQEKIDPKPTPMFLHIDTMRESLCN